MKWYIAILILMSYPIAELSRLIWVYYWNYGHDGGLLIEFSLMWVSYIVGITIMAWRLSKNL